MNQLRGSQDVAGLLRTLSETPQRLSQLVDGRSDAALDRAAPNEWSARTVLAHLRADEFLVMRLRLERMLAESQPQLAPFDEKTWAEGRYTGRDRIEELLGDFRTQRAASLAILQALTPPQLLRTAIQPEYGQFDLHWWLEHWAEHDTIHLNQIQTALS